MGLGRSCLFLAGLALLGVACGLATSGTGQNVVGTLEAGTSGDGSTLTQDGDGAGAVDEAGVVAKDAGERDGGPCALADGGAGMACGGVCLDTAHDRSNCGGCAVACAASAACEGTCVDVAASLVGFRLEVPCNNAATSNVSTKTAALTGTASKTYALALRFRGVLEQKNVNGSSAGGAVGTNAGLFVLGGSASGDAWNEYSLAIQAPAATFFLNAGASNHSYVDGIDYKVTLTAAAGTTLTLKVDPHDALEAGNHDMGGTPIVVAGIAPAPKAFDGQFVQVDVESVTLR